MIDPAATRREKPQRQQERGEGRSDRPRREKRDGQPRQSQPRQPQPRQSQPRQSQPRQSQPQGQGAGSQEGRRQQRPGGRGQKQQSREPLGRVCTSKQEKAPPAPLTKEMREGKKPLRTFGDLKQFFLAQQEPEQEPKPEVQPEAAAGGGDREGGEASPASTEG